MKLHCSGGHTLELPANVSSHWLGELLSGLITHAGKIWMVVEPVDMT